jgi:cyanophycinase
VGDLVMGLLGAGEFEPWSFELEAALLAHARRGDGSVLIAPTASAPEGDVVFDSWAARGCAHYAGAGIPARVLGLKTRADADAPALVAELETPSMIFFSGGNPAYLAATLRGSAFWETLGRSLGEGLAYVGCSAGVACLNEITFDTDTTELDQMWKPGLGFARKAFFAPHWDTVEAWVPGARRFILDAVPDGHAFVGLEEETAMMGEGSSWAVLGKGTIDVRMNGVAHTYRSGDQFSLPIAG